MYEEPVLSRRESDTRAIASLPQTFNVKFSVHFQLNISCVLRSQVSEPIGWSCHDQDQKYDFDKILAQSIVINFLNYHTV